MRRPISLRSATASATADGRPCYMFKVFWISCIFIIVHCNGSGVIGGNNWSVEAAKPELRAYRKGEKVELYVNAITSTKELYPLDYYSFPFCQQPNGPRKYNGGKEYSYGQFMSGDRIETSPYEVSVLKDEYCKQVCVANLGRAQQTGMMSNKVVRAIQGDYHNNWILDGLTSKGEVQTSDYLVENYNQGFPIGYEAKPKGQAFIYNHVNIRIMYTRKRRGRRRMVTSDKAYASVTATNVYDEYGDGDDDDDSDYEYEIFRFVIEPFSINHDFEPIYYLEDDDGNENKNRYDDDDDEDSYRIVNPIISCRRRNSTSSSTTNSNNNMYHTSYDMVQRNKLGNAKASGPVLFTYDVVWVNVGEMPWTDRYSLYFRTNNGDLKFWLTVNIFMCLILLVLLAARLCHIFWQRQEQQQQFQHHHQQPQQQRPPTMSGEPGGSMASFSAAIGTGRQFNIASSNRIRALRRDVFRPPDQAAHIFSWLCGIGVQILSTMVLFSSFAINRGLSFEHMTSSAWTIALMSFAISEFAAGYVMAVVKKKFFWRDGETSIPMDIKSWPDLKVMAAPLLFPLGLLLLYIITDIINFLNRSTLSVSLGSILRHAFVWLLVAVPMVIAGSYVGYTHSPSRLYFPVRPRTLRRQIPEQPQYLKLPWQLLWAGILPFVAILDTFSHLMAAMWKGSYDTQYLLSMASFICFLASCSLISALSMVHQFEREDHQWWWKSYFVGGSSSIYLFLYSLFHYGYRQASAQFIFLIDMTTTCFGLFVVSGFVSVATCYIFNAILFRYLTPSLDDIDGSDDIDGDDEDGVDYMRIIDEPDDTNGTGNTGRPLFEDYNISPPAAAGAAPPAVASASIPSEFDDMTELTMTATSSSTSSSVPLTNMGRFKTERD